MESLAESLMGRPKSKRKDVAVKVDAETVRKARHVANDRGVTLAQYLSELLATPVDTDYRAFISAESGRKPRRSDPK